MLSYEKNFAPREDGRFVCTMAGQMEMIRQHKLKLSLPEKLNTETFAEWQGKVKDKLTELLQMPEATEQPAPKLLSTVQREGYRVEKWEFYPDDYLAVPYLALIPDEASKENKVPAVMCFLGSNHSKEFVSGEEQIDHPNCLVQRYPERNQMAKYLAQNGMAAFVFDNPGIGEVSVMCDKEYGEQQFLSRIAMSYGYLQMGMNYPGVSTFQKLQFMKHLETVEYVDQDRIGISSHSLGTVPAISVGILSDKIKAIVFNDNLQRDMRKYVAVTEAAENRTVQNTGMWHIIPGIFSYFGYPELCAAFAPRMLALTEGGPDENLDIVRSAYDACNASDNLQITHYPNYSDDTVRTFHGKIPDKGLTADEYYAYSYCDVPEHSFKKEPALKLFKDAFGLK